jgi:hypothetical protein
MPEMVTRFLVSLIAAALVVFRGIRSARVRDRAAAQLKIIATVVAHPHTASTAAAGYAETF